MRKIGVEEEMFLVDPQTCRMMPVSPAVMAADERNGHERGGLQQELFLEQIEANTEPTEHLAELRERIVAARGRAASAAEDVGVAVLASPTPLFAHSGGQVTPKPRYERMVALCGEAGRQSTVSGMHVHVDVSSSDEGVRIIDHIQPWLPVLIALAANSPFDHGVDTAYASWRGEVWDRWPSAAPVEPFGDTVGYRDAVRRLVESGAAIDEGMIYFDARLAVQFDTVELRVADVCTDVDDAVVVAALSRALVETSASTDGPPATRRLEMLRAGRFLARRHGLSGSLLDPRDAEPRPAHEVVATLLDHVGPALRAAGDDQVVGEGVERLVRDGGGAGRQRAVAGPDVDLDAVARDLLHRTGVA